MSIDLQPIGEGYAAYAAWGGTAPAEKWTGLAAHAARVIRDVTFGRDLTADASAVTEATYRVVEVLWGIESGVTSEKLGSYSYTKSSVLVHGDEIAEARVALAGTGLTYQGL